MKSAIEFLQEETKGVFTLGVHSELQSQVLNAMELFKEQMSNHYLEKEKANSTLDTLAFAEFCRKYNDEDLLANQWMDYSLNNRGILTTAEVYNDFLMEKSKIENFKDIEKAKGIKLEEKKIFKD